MRHSKRCVDRGALGSIRDVAALIDRPVQTVCNWVTRGSFDVPQPIADTQAGRVFDLTEWVTWGRTVGADMIGPGATLGESADV